MSRSLIEEGPFQPRLQRRHELLRGVGIDETPPLHGYVVTYGKPAAEVLLTTPADDPLLAVQRYGLGHTAAFTADLGPRWGKEWLSWPQFGPFTAQLVRWVQRTATPESVDVQVDVRDGQAVVRADVYDPEDRFVNRLDLQGSRVLTPQKDTLPLQLEQTAPGRYQGRFAVSGRGEYLLSLVGRQGEATIGPKTVGIALPYSAEYLGLDVNHALLTRPGGTYRRPGAAPSTPPRKPAASSSARRRPPAAQRRRAGRRATSGPGSCWPPCASSSPKSPCARSACRRRGRRALARPPTRPAAAPRLFVRGTRSHRPPPRRGPPAPQT